MVSVLSSEKVKQIWILEENIGDIKIALDKNMLEQLLYVIRVACTITCKEKEDLDKS